MFLLEVGDCDSTATGYLDMTSTRVSTPSTGTASKSSTRWVGVAGVAGAHITLRSRTVSKSSASSYLPSATASPRFDSIYCSLTSSAPSEVVEPSTGPTTR